LLSAFGDRTFLREAAIAGTWRMGNSNARFESSSVTTIDDLCDRHEYPIELRAVLTSLVESARREIDGLKALVLTGSIATGDFVWRGDADGARLLSDIDVIAFAERAGPRPAFSAAVRKLEHGQTSELFHIDVVISSMSAMRRLQHSYQFVEARLSGVAPIGRETLESFPRHFDPRGVRQSFFDNIRKGVLSWPGPEDHDDEAYRLALARMILDLPILAFSEGGRCIPGHAARVDEFLALEETHPLADHSTRRAASTALRMRQRGDVPLGDLSDLVPEVIDRLFNFLDRKGPAGAADEQLARRIGRLLPPRRPRRLAGELRAALRDTGLWWKDPGWWLRRKEAMAGAALIGLLRFALSGASGSPEPGITALLRAYTGGRAPTGEGPIFLDEARRIYWEGRCRLYPSEEDMRAPCSRFPHPEELD
jgi:hypothetical protein